MADDKDADNSMPEPYRGRAQRFSLACVSFETRFGISLDSEVDHLVPDGHLEKIRTGAIDVIEGLRPNDLWAVLLSLHIDLDYVLWDKPKTPPRQSD